MVQLARRAPVARIHYAGREADSSTDRSSDSARVAFLGDEIADVAAHLDAATYRLLTLLHEFDARDGWHPGFRTCAHWLSWRTGMDLGAAREKMRVARALHVLPGLSHAMRHGVLSYSKARALTRVATPENESELLELALHGTAAHIERIVRAWRTVDRLAEAEQEQQRHERRELSLFIDDDGSYVLRGRLDPEAGALLERALEMAREELYGRQAGGSVAQEFADAIGLVAELALQRGGGEVRGGADECGDGEVRATADEAGSDSAADSARPVSGMRAERFQVVLHVDRAALQLDAAAPRERDAGMCDLANGVRVSAETSRRLACDATRVIMTHGADGRVLDVGRRTRTVPAALRRALDYRDRCCRFPGCGLRFCDAHHVTHWADGGATALDNLVLLCRFHHRLLHEDGYAMSFDWERNIVFRDPEGECIQDSPVPEPVRGDAVHRLREDHGRAGLEIDEDTAPVWDGDRLDLHLAVLMLRPMGDT